MGKVKAPPSEIKEVYSYDPDTGEFKHIQSGRITLPTHSEGYHRVQFRGDRYFVHRLAYWWDSGEWPEEVDHKNLNTSDNRLCNLRAATQKQNSCNRTPRGVSRYRGVTWFSRNKKCGVCLKKNGIPHYLGLFDSEHRAAVEYNKMAIELHGEFAVYNDVFSN